MMPGDDVPTERAARRIEVFTEAGRRRKWSADAKARIVGESYALSVGEVGDRYGLAKTQLFTWRRDALAKVSAPTEPAPLPFAPVIVEPTAAPVATRPKPSRKRARRGGDGSIALEIGGVAVRRARGGRQDCGGADPGVEDGGVIGPTGQVWVLVASKPVDFRKGMDVT